MGLLKKIISAPQKAVQQVAHVGESALQTVGHAGESALQSLTQAVTPGVRAVGGGVQQIAKPFVPLVERASSMVKGPIERFGEGPYMPLVTMGVMAYGLGGALGALGNLGTASEVAAAGAYDSAITAGATEIEALSAAEAAAVAEGASIEEAAAIAEKISTIAPAAAAPGMLDQALAGVKQGAIQGGLSSAQRGLNPIPGAITGGTFGGITSGIESGVGAGLQDIKPLVSGTAAGAAAGATKAALVGGDIKQGALQGGATGLFRANEAPAPSDEELNALIDEQIASEETPVSKTPGMLPALASPESVAAFLETVSEPVQGTALPIGGQEVDITSPADIVQTLGAQVAPTTPESEVTPPEAPSTPGEAGVTTKEVIDYAKQAKKVYDLYNEIVGGRGSVDEFQPPERSEGESDEEYFTAVGDAAVDYLGLDAERMRALGLKPGTPEYLNYILKQANFVIEQIFGGDPSALLEGESADSLKDMLRNLTEQEAQKLARVMYVRGALGQMGFAESVEDPFTGISERLGLLSGEQASGAEAAQQRGYARFVSGLSGQSSQEARNALAGLFGRDVDLYDLQKNADARKRQAMLAEMADEERKRRKKLADQTEQDNEGY